MEEKLFNALNAIIVEMEAFWKKEGVIEKYAEANMPEQSEFDKAYYEAKYLIEEYKLKHA